MSAQISHQSERPLNPTIREMITVDPARIHVSVRLPDSLVAYGLGSCICVCLYDCRRKIAGMAYVTLPSSDHFKDSEATTFNQPARFVDQALPVLLDAMRKSGATPANIRAAIVGGAHVQRAAKSAASLPDLFQSGTAIVAEATRLLETAGIAILGKDIGGSRGRTVVFRVCDGCVIVKSTATEAQVVAMLNVVGDLAAA
jgi:chemotaxis protein CheD